MPHASVHVYPSRECYVFAPREVYTHAIGMLLRASYLVDLWRLCSRDSSPSFLLIVLHSRELHLGVFIGSNLRAT